MSIVSAVLRPEAESQDYAPLLKWILTNTIAAAGLVVLWYFGIVQQLLDTDRTRVSLLIFAIFVVTAGHCLYQTIIVSRELVAARKVRAAVVASPTHPLSMVGGQVVTAAGQVLPPGILTNHIINLITRSKTVGGRRFDQTLLLRSLADQLRAREKLGWFVSEALLRLALLGTAIGFILMLIPLAGLSGFDVETLRQTLTGMSSGMAIALNVTITGIAAALLLKFEYYLLDEAIADLFHSITELTEVYVVPTLEPVADDAERA